MLQRMDIVQIGRSVSSGALKHVRTVVPTELVQLQDTLVVQYHVDTVLENVQQLRLRVVVHLPDHMPIATGHEQTRLDRTLAVVSPVEPVGCLINGQTGRPLDVRTHKLLLFVAIHAGKDDGLHDGPNHYSIDRIDDDIDRMFSSRCESRLVGAVEVDHEDITLLFIDDVQVFR